MNKTTDDSKRIEIHIEDNPEKWGGKMNKDIEETTVREAIEILALSPFVDERSRNAAKTVCIKVTQLLFSLKKEKEGHVNTIDQLDKAAGKHLNNLSKIADLEVAIEKEKEQTEYFRLETNRLTDELAKEKEEIIFWKKSYDEELAHSKHCEERLKEVEQVLDDAIHYNQEAEKRLESERVSVNELSLANQELTERIKELEATLASIKADESIGKLIVEDDFGEGD